MPAPTSTSSRAFSRTHTHTHTHMLSLSLRVSASVYSRCCMLCAVCSVSWLPTFHDMGLIGMHVSPLLGNNIAIHTHMYVFIYSYFSSCHVHACNAGYGTVLYMSPLDFLENPLSWLQVMSDWSAHTPTSYSEEVVDSTPTHYHEKYRYISSAAPPFALELCVARLVSAPAKFTSSLNLSRLNMLILGAGTYHTHIYVCMLYCTPTHSRLYMLCVCIQSQSLTQPSHHSHSASLHTVSTSTSTPLPTAWPKTHCMCVANSTTHTVSLCGMWIDVR